MAYKVFTNGSVLQASEINDNLMRQSVMVFSNAAARTAAITSPVEGMLTYLEDTDNYQKWTGSLWAMADDVALLANVNFTATTSVILSNVFSSTYDNYFVQVTTDGVGGNARFQLRTGTTNATTGYGGTVVYAISTSALATTRSTTFFESFGDYISAYLYRPFLTQRTGWHAMSTSGGTAPGLDAGQNTNLVSYDGLVLSFATNATGTIRVYGLRK